MADACGRCGGKGWRWTGTERVRCSARGCSTTTPPADPIRAWHELVPRDRWLAVARVLGGR